MAKKRRGRKASGKTKQKWIQGAVKKPGQLHRDLGVKQGQKIPHSRLRTAAKKKGKVGQRARFALAMHSVRRKRTRKKQK